MIADVAGLPTAADISKDQLMDDRYQSVATAQLNRLTPYSKTATEQIMNLAAISWSGTISGQAYGLKLVTSGAADYTGTNVHTYHLDGHAVYTQVSYDGNGATSGSVSPQAGFVGNTVTVAANGFTKPGYKFVGWKDQNGTSYAVGSEYTLYESKGEAKLYAQWEEDEKALYNVMYTAEANGSVSVSTNADLQKLHADKVTGSTATANAGYEFVGWYKGDTLVSADAALTAAAAQAALNKDADGLYADTAFVAKFTERTDLSYTVNYIDRSTNTNIDTKSVDKQTYGASVTEEAGAFANYVLDDEAKKSITIGTSGNVINFYYKPVISDDNKRFSVDSPSNSVYDGTAHNWAPTVKDGEKTLVADTDYTVTYNTNDFTNVTGAITVTITGKGNYAGSVTRTYQITPLQIALSSNGGSKTYDGTALTDDAVTVTSSNGNAEVFKSEVTDLKATGSVTHVAEGKVNNTITYTPTDKFLASNYTFADPVEGQLYITSRAVELTSATASKPYDGTALTANEVYVTKGSFVEGEGFTYNCTGSIIDPGTTKNSFNYDFTEGTQARDYDLDLVEGTLTVAQNTNTIVITAGNASKDYDGTALTNSGYTYTQGVLAEGDVLTAVVEGTITNAGTAANKVTSYKVMRGDVDVTANYTFGDSVDGTLTVNKRTVTLTSATDSKIYDGTALTNSTVTATEFDAQTGKGFVAGEGATYDVTGSQTVVGGSANAFTYTLNEGTNADNYIINKEEGTLTVSAIATPIVITANSNSKTYDGTALTDTRFSYTQGVLASGDTLVAATSGSQTNAGSSANTVTSYKVTNASGVDVTSCYTFGPSVDGTLTVNKRSVTLTSANGSKTYDGEALTAGTVTVTGDGFATGEGATYDVTGSQTNAGSSANAFSYALNQGTLADNYDITTVVGTLEVTKRNVTLTSGSAEKTYDGTALTNADVTATGDGFAAGEGATYDVTGSQTEAGSSANTFTYTLNQGTLADNYNITTEVGTLKVNAIGSQIIITADNASKVYDGTALVDSGFTYTDNVLVEGDVLTAVVEGSIIDAGTAANKVTSYKVMRGDVDVTTSYTFGASVDGTLTVTPRSVTLTSGSASKPYDGTALTNATVTVTDGSFVDGEGYTATVTGSQTNAGEGSNTFTYSLNQGTSAGNYQISIVDGTLTVNKRNVTLTSGSATKAYDGTALTNATVTVTDGFFVDGEGYTATVTGSQTDVGSSANAFTYTLNQGTSADNYNVTTVEGNLVVTKNQNEIVIAAASAKKTYDGQPLTSGEFTYTQGVLAEGDVLTAVVEGTITNAGTAANKVTSYQVMRGDTDVTAFYTFGDSIDGTLEVTKRNVTLTSGSAEKTYDGTALTNSEVTVAGDGFAAGEGATYDVTGSQTEAGSSANTFSYTLNEGTNADNYNITTKIGALTVNAIGTPITITAASASKVYDGKALVAGSYSFTDGVLVNGDKLTAVVEGSQTDAGESANKVTSYKVMRGDVDVTSCYTFNDSVDGTLTVDKRSVTLTSGSAEKTYDGTALTNSEVTVTGDGFAMGEGATYDVTGSQTTAGTSANTFTYTLNNGTKADNYLIKTAEGTLTVNKVTAAIVVTANSNSKTYDGQALAEGGYTYTQGVLATGDTLTATTSGSQTNVGSSANKVASYQVTNAAGVDVTSSYTFGASVDGTLTVNKRSVTLTSGSAEKTYDGTALINSEVTVTGDGFAAGEGATYDVTGSQLTAGQSNNTFNYALSEGTDSANYQISMVEGTLKVNAIGTPITITANSNKKTYDGQALTDAGFTYTEGVLVNGDVLTAVVEGSQTNAGISANKVASYQVTNAAGVDVTAGYLFKESVDGALTVVKRSVTLTSATPESKMYDGTALTDSTVTVTGDGFAAGEGATYDVTGAQTNAGNSKNTFTYTLDQGTLADNYQINMVEGDLVVTTRTVVMTSATAEKVYDGTALTDSTVTVTGDGFAAGEGATYSVTGAQTNAGSSKNTFTYTLDQGTLADNYQISTVEGTLTVKKNESVIVVTAASDSKTYDGQPLTSGEFTYTQGVLADGDVLTAVVEGSITDAGTAANKVTSYKVMRGDVDVTANYTFGDSVDGTLTITKRSVVLTSESASKTYDGTALTNSTVTASGDGFVEGEGFIANVTGSQTEAGSSANTFSYTLNEGTNADNYNISTVEGTLKVTAQPINPDDPAYQGIQVSTLEDVVYNGQDQLQKPTVTDKNGNVLVEGTDYTITYTSDVRNVGQVTITVTGIGNYSGTVDRTYNIVPLQIKLVSKTTSKTYDGSALTAPEVTATSGNGDVAVFERQTYSVKATGTVTTVAEGTVTNAIAIEPNPAFSESNYIITKEEGTLSIDKRNVTLTSASDSKVYDGTALTNNTVTASEDGFVNGEGATYEVTGFQTLVGESSNVFAYTAQEGTDFNNYNITKVEGTLAVTDRDNPSDPDPSVDPDKVVTKTHEAKEYALGETVTFTITVVNIYDQVRTVDITEQEGVTITGASHFDAVQPGATVTTTATYTVTEADILAGTFTNKVDVTIGGVPYSNTDTVEIADQEPNLTVAKTASITEGAQLGQTVNYTITVTNNGNVTVTGINLVDNLTGHSWTIDSLAPGQSANAVSDYYTITEADILAGRVVNTATATGTDPTGQTTKGDSPEVITTTQDVNPQLTVTKTSDVKAAAFLGQTVTYNVIVKNTGNVTISNVTVSDPKVDAEWTLDDPLAPGEEMGFGATYVVTEADVLAGQVVNVATANGTDPNGNPIPEAEGSITDETEKAAPSIAIEKVSDVAEGAQVTLGQTINYTIYVVNNGNVTLTDVAISDELTGDTWTIDTLAPSVLHEFTTTHVVTEADVLAGQVLNNVTATGTDPEGNPVPPAEDQVTNNTEDPNGHITITKTATSTPANGTAYGLGETITYQVVATNDGNLTLTDVVVTDELTGDSWNVGTFAPGQTQTLEASYVVTSEDVLAGHVLNQATATGTSPDPGSPTPGVVPGSDDEPTDTPAASLFVSKVVTNTPANGTAYAQGEVITYRITVTNNGNVDLANIRVADPLTGDTWTIGNLAAGTQQAFDATYTVTAGDLGNNVTNVAAASADDPANPGTPVGDTATVTSTTDTPVVPVPTPVAPTGGITPDGTTPDATTITDNPTPQANIDDNANPLAQPDDVSCWVHWLIILGMILTAIYGLGVVIRRQNYTNRLNRRDDDTMGNNQGQSQTTPQQTVAPSGAAPVMAQGTEA